MFFTEEDCTVYLDWMKEDCDEHRVETRAYCLMTAHTHLVAIPERRLATGIETIAHRQCAKGYLGTRLECLVMRHPGVLCGKLGLLIFGPPPTNQPLAVRLTKILENSQTSG